MKTHQEKHSSHRFSLLPTFQNGDSYLMALSARYAQDLGVTPLHEVLQQLEDLRLAEWSDHAPPPPPPPPNQQQQQGSVGVPGHRMGGVMPAQQQQGGVMQSYHQVRTSDHMLHSRGELKRLTDSICLAIGYSACGVSFSNFPPDQLQLNRM